MTLTLKDPDVDFPLPLARKSVLSVSSILRRRVAGVCFLVMSSLGPSIVNGGETNEDVAASNRFAEKEASLKKMLVAFLELPPVEIALVMTSENLTNGNPAEWDGLLMPSDFGKYKVFKVDFPRAVDTTYYVRELDGAYYFSLEPHFLFGEKDKVIGVPQVLNKKRFLATAFAEAPAR